MRQLEVQAKPLQKAFSFGENARKLEQHTSTFWYISQCRQGQIEDELMTFGRANMRIKKAISEIDPQRPLVQSLKRLQHALIVEK